MIGDSLGRPLRFRLSAGQRHDDLAARDLLAQAVLADRTYNNNDLRQTIADMGAHARPFRCVKAYDVTQFVHDLRDRSVTPHIAIDAHLNKTGKAAQDGDRCTYHTSERLRHQPTLPQTHRRVFGRIKSSAGLAKVKPRGRDRVDAGFVLAPALRAHWRRCDGRRR